MSSLEVLENSTGEERRLVKNVKKNIKKKKCKECKKNVKIIYKECKRILKKKCKECKKIVKIIYKELKNTKKRRSIKEMIIHLKKSWRLCVNTFIFYKYIFLYIHIQYVDIHILWYIYTYIV